MAALVVVLGWAVWRPRGLPEAVVAVPAALLVIATGAISAHDAGEQARRLGPVIGFLAAVLVLAQLCDDEGLFRACGAWLARAAAGRPQRLLALVFAVAAVTTAVLSLDATVVLLTPVVFATAARLEVRARPHLYACTHLSNSGSLLLPVSNLTNLLAFAASGLSFGRFAGLMALPWLGVIGTEYVVFRRFFAADLAAGGQPVQDADAPEVPVFTLAVVAATLAGFVLASAAGVNPAWAALAGVVVLGARALAQRRTSVPALARAADAPFLLFVLSLGIVVQAVTGNGLGSALRPLVPTGTSLAALLGVAALAAGLANVINNLPAVLILLPLAAPAGPAAILAVLLGVNIGPNLTYTGSLATLLWRRVLRQHGSGPSLWEFTRLGLLTVPAGAGHRGARPMGGTARTRRLTTCPTPKPRSSSGSPREPGRPASTRRCVSSSPAPRSPCCTSPPPSYRTPRTAPTWDCSAEAAPTATPARTLPSWPRNPPRSSSTPPPPASAWPGRIERSGVPEREVVTAVAGAALLIVARDGDRSRLGPKSLGKATRFVVDHAPCPVLVVWPEAAPTVATIPPAPPHPPDPPEPPGPPGP